MDDPAERYILQPPFVHRGGQGWVALLAGVTWPNDGNDGVRSRLDLWENGTRLGPRHSAHPDIESEGSGRFSHWQDAVIFSTSDGSDPNVNGRRYSISLGEPTLTTVGFGSCHLHDALLDLEDRKLAPRAWQSPVQVYTPRETAQLVAFYAGEQDIPPWLRTFTVTNQAGAEPGRLAPAELGFVEFGSFIDIAYGPFWLTRSRLHTLLIDPIVALGRDGERAIDRWYNQGLLRRNEAVRAESAEEVLQFVPMTDLDPAVARDILRQARGCEQDAAAAAETVRHLRDMLQVSALSVLGTQNAFLPDGRPLNWPANFPKVLDEVCSKVGLPLLNTGRLAAERGGAFAIKPDLIHFTPQMISVMADEMLAMGRQALQTNAAGIVGSAAVGDARPVPAMQF